MAFGLTFKATELLCQKLAHKLNINYMDLYRAMEELTKEEVVRIARNIPMEDR